MKMSSSTYPSKRHSRNKFAEMSMLLTVKMKDSNWVPVALYEKIKTQIKQNIPHLHSDIYLVPEDLVGNEFWCALSESEKHMAKICIAHISVTKALSIRAREFDLEYAHVYDLRYKDLIASNDDFSDYHY